MRFSPSAIRDAQGCQRILPSYPPESLLLAISDLLKIAEWRSQSRLHGKQVLREFQALSREGELGRCRFLLRAFNPVSPLNSVATANLCCRFFCVEQRFRVNFCRFEIRNSLRIIRFLQFDANELSSLGNGHVAFATNTSER